MLVTHTLQKPTFCCWCVCVGGCQIIVCITSNLKTQAKCVLEQQAAVAVGLAPFQVALWCSLVGFCVHQRLPSVFKNEITITRRGGRRALRSLVLEAFAAQRIVLGKFSGSGLLGLLSWKSRN